MSFLKTSLNQVTSVTEPPCYLDTGHSVSVLMRRLPNLPLTSTAGRRARVVTGHLSSLVTAGTPGPPGGPACSGPWRGEGTGPQGLIPPRARFSKNSSFQKRKENPEKTGVCEHFLPPPCVTSFWEQRLPQKQTVHTGAGAAQAKCRGTSDEPRLCHTGG